MKIEGRTFVISGGQVCYKSTESIAAAVEGAIAWSKETGKEIGGVVAAAGVSLPGKVCCLFFLVEGTSLSYVKYDLLFLTVSCSTWESLEYTCY